VHIKQLVSRLAAFFYRKLWQSENINDIFKYMQEKDGLVETQGRIEGGTETYCFDLPALLFRGYLR
jgi:hypothetical protein